MDAMARGGQRTFAAMLDYSNPALTLDTSSVSPGSITWRSPSNLAIVKYWGKHGQQLPRNPSVSFTLNNALTQTTLEYAPKKGADTGGVSLDFYFHDEQNEAFATRLQAFLDSLLPIFPFLGQLDLTIRSANSFPHSAGIASSASAMSALALCLCSLEDELFDTLGDDEAFDRKASYVARLGSGSACRSVFGKAGWWGAMSEVPGSNDRYAVPMADELHEVFQHFHDDILIAGAGEKSVSSTAGHGLMDDNPYAGVRYDQAAQRLRTLLPALQTGDVDTFGRIAEAEALTLHALMMASNPPYLLLKGPTLEIIERVQRFRRHENVPLYFSLDAGPNPHLLYPEEVIHQVRPFIESELLPFCEDGRWLTDWVGEGPEQV